MLVKGDRAPSFTATMANGDVEPFELKDQLGEGPVVLAFFPGAFTPPCSNEMVALQQRIGEFEAAGATVFGVSVDSPFAQNAFREEHGLEFDLVSDTACDVIEAYDLRTDVPDIGLYGVSNRAVFVLDEDGTVTYGWVADEPADEPDYGELLEAVRAA